MNKAGSRCEVCGKLDLLSLLCGWLEEEREDLEGNSDENNVEDGILVKEEKTQFYGFKPGRVNS